MTTVNSVTEEKLDSKCVEMLVGDNENPGLLSKPDEFSTKAQKQMDAKVRNDCHMAYEKIHSKTDIHKNMSLLSSKYPLFKFIIRGIKDGCKWSITYKNGSELGRCEIL